MFVARIDAEAIYLKPPSKLKQSAVIQTLRRKLPIEREQDDKIFIFRLSYITMYLSQTDKENVCLCIKVLFSLSNGKKEFIC